MEDKLSAIVDRIAASVLSDSEKDELYAVVYNALVETVMPVVLSHVPQEKLNWLTTGQTHPDPELLHTLISTAMEDQTTERDLMASLTGVLAHIEDALKSEGV